MNDTEKKLSLLSRLDIITQNDYHNNQYDDYCFYDVNFILINNVYYYIKSSESLKIILEDNYFHCIIINENTSNRNDFEIKYSDINDILIKLR